MRQSGGNATVVIKKDLSKLQKELENLLKSNATTFGAPVLSAKAGKDVVVEDPNWEPPKPNVTRLTEPPVEKRNCTAKECSNLLADPTCECQHFKRKCPERECAQDNVDPLCICDNADVRTQRQRRCS